MIDLIGLGIAALAGTCWGCYNVITQHVGDQFSGITGLSITLPIAAIATAVVGVSQSAGHLTPMILLAGLGLGLLHPLLTFTLEMTALKRMTTAAFGTLMAVEPAIVVLLRLLVLQQRPTVAALRGRGRLGPSPTRA